MGEVERSDPFIPDFVLLARDGLRVATGSTNGLVRVWDLDRGGPTRELSTHPMNVRPMAFLPRSEGILLQHENNSISEWSLIHRTGNTSLASARQSESLGCFGG